VFESLNSKGMPLTTADLARNLLFSDVEYEEQENFAWLEAAGFEAPSVEESFEVEADRGYKAGHVVPKVAGDENVKFTAVSLCVRKKR
ncbi:hypothetical protein, partial [Ellagibacter isourolithinifaciens]|uniref:hypothetical protein n=1 Tax=Ellagibacter isourolithinifaciens TaxID=2137581 RepID=UPI003A8E1864